MYQQVASYRILSASQLFVAKMYLSYYQYIMFDFNLNLTLFNSYSVLAVFRSVFCPRTGLFFTTGKRLFFLSPAARIF